MLIVDDNAMNIAIAQVVLLAEKFEVETATDGVQAMLKVASFQPDLFLMDIQMTATDGIQIIANLRAGGQTGTFASLPSRPSRCAAMKARLRAAGCDGYLSKPIDVNKFGAQVLACLTASTNDEFRARSPDGRN